MKTLAGSTFFLVLIFGAVPWATAHDTYVIGKPDRIGVNPGKALECNSECPNRYCPISGMHSKHQGVVIVSARIFKRFWRVNFYNGTTDTTHNPTCIAVCVRRSQYDKNECPDVNFDID